jgi:hypothetical protein
MKLGARIIPAMAVAFFLVPTLFADDTAKPADLHKKDESVNSATTPGPSDSPEKPGKTRLSLPAAPSPTTPAGEGMGKHSDRHGRQSKEHGNTTPKVELFMGYSFWRAVPDSTRNRMDAMHGGSAFTLDWSSILAASRLIQWSSPVLGRDSVLRAWSMRKATFSPSSLARAFPSAAMIG